MPEQPKLRAKIEREIERRLAAIAPRHRELLTAAMGEPPDPRKIPARVWRLIERETKRELYWPLLKGFLSAAVNTWNALDKPDLGDDGPPLPPEDERPGRNGLELPPVNRETDKRGRRWADKRAGEIAKGVVATAKAKLEFVRRESGAVAESRRTTRVTEAPKKSRGKKATKKSAKRSPPKRVSRKQRVAPTRAKRRANRGQLFKRQPTYGKVLDDIFGEDRWRTVAITETTGTISGGEVELLRQLERNRGWKFDMTWYTSKGDNVCPICKPLHGKPRSYFARRVGFPPAHPRCNCYLRYKVLHRGGMAPSRRKAA